MKKVIFVIVGIIVIGFIGKYFINSAIGSDLPENEARLVLVEKKIEKSKKSVEQVTGAEHQKILKELEMLAMEKILVKHSIASSKFYVEMSLIRLIYTALKNKLVDKTYLRTQYYNHVYQQLKDADCEFCPDEFKQAFEKFLELTQKPIEKEIGTVESKMFEIYREQKKSMGKAKKETD
jgi:hypothetical protein